MKVNFLKYWERMHSSFWFVPAILALASTALAFSAVALDEQAADVLSSWGWLYSGGAEGASAVLQTIAGSMITIAGVVFSMTLVALTLASAQFGPRLLRNFMSDTINQLVLGTFIATFIYCLLVMRTIRREDEAAFVPHLSVTLGVLLALVSMAVLIYFIHHVSVSIQADEVVARVAKELDEGLDRLFPEDIGNPKPPDEGRDRELLEVLKQESTAVDARQDGYLQFVDADALISLAVEYNLVIRLLQRPGQYVTADRPLVLLAPAARVSGEVTDAVSESILVGSQRTPSQDIEFAISQLVEIAVRALSPGINDPFTAIRCADRLSSAIYRLGRRPMPSPYRRDENNRLRIVAPPVSFTEILDASFGQIRQNARSSAAVTIRLMEVMAIIAESANRPEDRNAVLRHARLIADAGSELPEEADRATVDERLQAVLQALNGDS
jgi:uncharacterized membrane protein